MIEHLIRFINSKNTFQLWRIVDSKGNELFEYESEDIEAIQNQVASDYPFLEAGTYMLMGKQTKFQGEKSFQKLPFKIVGETKQPTQTAPKMSVNTFTADQVDKMVKEAEERGRRDARLDTLERDFYAFLVRYEKDLKAIEKATADKFDELDGKNDNDFVGKATDAIAKIAPQMPAISEGLKGFKL